MEALLQRVQQASVSVEGEQIGAIGPGLVIFLGVRAGDTEEDIRYLATKVTGLRIFPDEQGKLNCDIKEAGGEVLVVSQFTLLAQTRKGRRPSFTEAAPPEIAETLVTGFIECLRSEGLPVATGRFQAHMMVEIHNDGPVTIPLSSSDRLKPRKSA